MSELMVAMAIVKANWNENRDYLSNFEPFVAETLRTWPEGEPVKPKSLRDRLDECFSIPQIPIHTAEALIARARKDRLVVSIDGSTKKLIANKQQLASLPDLSDARSRALRHINEIISKMIEYATEFHDVEWGPEDAERALDRFIRKFSVQLAISMGGEISNEDSFENDMELIVVHGFVRNAVRTEDEILEYLEEMVKGSFLTDQLYFHELGDYQQQLDKLTVYLDTSICLRLLGMSPEPQEAAAKELLAMLKKQRVPVRVFQHTLSEIHGVLGGVVGGLRRLGLSSAPTDEQQAHVETIEALALKGSTPADIQEVSSNLETLLSGMGVIAVDTPPIPERPNFSESALDAELEKVISYRNPNARAKDAKSLVAVHILRGSGSYNQLARTPAIFVTSNPKVAKASYRYFKSEGLESPVRHCVTDVTLTTQLWIRMPNQSPDVARTVLVAEAFAALRPSDELWNRYVQQINAVRSKGQISDEQFKSLVYSIDAQEQFFEVSRGSEMNINEETPLVVLERYETQIRRPAELQKAKSEEEAQLARKLAEKERLRADSVAKKLSATEEEVKRQRLKVDDLTKWKSAQETEKQRRSDRRRKRFVAVLFGSLAMVPVAVSGYLILDSKTGSAIDRRLLAICVIASVAFCWCSYRCVQAPTKIHQLAAVTAFSVAVSAALALIFEQSTLFVLGAACSVFGLVAAAIQLIDRASDRARATG